MVGVGMDERTRWSAVHTLHLLGVCGAAELFPHVMQMAARWVDGAGVVAINAWIGLRQRMGQPGLGRETVEKPLATRERMPTAGEPLGALPTRLVPRGRQIQMIKL